MSNENETGVQTIHVVVDTTTLHDQAAEMDSVAWKAVLAASKRGTIRLAIPLVVLKEAERQVKTATLDSLKSLKLTARKIRASASRKQLEEFLQDFEAAAKDDASSYLNRVNQKVTAHEGQTLKLPDVPHKDLFERAVNFVQPFKQDGSGYRDALIWLSVLEVAKGCPAGSNVYFVSHNTKDFGSDGVLAPHLSDDVSMARPDVTVHLVHKLQDLVSILDEANRRSTTQPAPPPASTTEDSAAASSGRSLAPVDYAASELETAITNAAEALLGGEFSVDDGPGLRIDADLPRSFQHPTLTGLSIDFKTLETQVYDAFDGGDRLLRCMITSDVEIDAVVDKADVHGLPDDIHVSIYGLNNHYSEVSATRVLNMVFDVMQSEGGYVQNCDFVEGESV